jgi:hypothetical protein
MFLDACGEQECNLGTTDECSGSLLTGCGRQFQCSFNGKPPPNDVLPEATGNEVIDLPLDGSLAQFVSEAGQTLVNLYFSYRWGSNRQESSTSPNLTDIRILYDGQPAQQCTFRPGIVRCLSIPINVQVISISFSYDGGGGPVTLDVGTSFNECEICTLD